MRISAGVSNNGGRHEVSVQTGEVSQTLAISPKPTGFGSSVNGGELLCLALATCYCNDLYREAAGMGLEVEVVMEGRFSTVGEPAQDLTYHVRVSSKSEESKVLELLRHTDWVAEVHNTLRVFRPVMLGRLEVVCPG